MSKCKITGKVLSIQLGREETLIALISGSEILHSVSLMTPEGAVEDGEIRNQDAVRDMLKRALREPEFKRVRQTVFTLCTTQVITTDPQTVPDLPEAKLEKLIAANMDTYFPVDIQDYHVVWQVIGPKTGESGVKEQEVKLWAIPQAMLGSYYTVANAVGLSVAAVSYCGSSIANALGASFAKPARKGAKAKKNSFLTMEIGFGKKKDAEPDGSDAAVATEVRNIPGTELHITAESDLLGMTFVQDGQVVMQRFIPCGANMTDVLGEVAMIGEYFRTLDAGRGSRVEGFLSGGLAFDNRLAADLEDMLGINLRVYQGEYDPQWLMCCGAALATTDFGIPALNSPGKARRQVQSQVWQYGLILVGGLALMSVILMLLSSRLVWNSSLSNLKANQQSLQIRAQQVAGYADNYNSYASAYDSYSADWDTVFANLQTYNDNLVLVLEELEQTLPEKASVTNMQISQEGMGVQFACENKEVAAYLIMALRELKYADLAAISNLSGGGAGPATGYARNEAAPTEGSFDPSAITESTVVDMIAGELSQEELMDLAFGMTDEEFEVLEAVYGRHPVNTYASLADLKSVNAGANPDVFFAQRSEALRTMLTTNPFAMNRFMNLMEEDFYRDEDAILWWYILDDLVKLEQEGAFGNGSVEDINTLRQYIEVLVNVLTKDDTTLTATEALICTDPVEEMWYVYYLEVEMDVHGPDKYPFLNMEKIVEDILAGGFETGDPELDEKLNGLISDEAWEKIDQLTSLEGIAELLDQFLLAGTTGDPEMDAMIHNFMLTGTTGVEELDKAINDYIASGAVDEHMGVLIERYLTTGTTGNAVIDQLIGNYLTTGTTGSRHMDDAINRYIASGKMDATLTELLDKYAVDGTTGVSVVDDMINKYLDEGTTGNPALDAMIADYISSVAASITPEMISEMIQSYMNTGSTGNKLYDILLSRYMTEGTTGNATLDAMIEEFLNGGGNEGGSTLPGGFTEAQIQELLEKYMKDGTTGNPVLDAMIDKYLNTGTTGMPELDALIEERIDQIIGSITEDEINEMIGKYLNDGTTGNKLYDKLIRKYLTEGTTGIDKLDKLIEEYFKNNNDGDASVWKDMLDRYIKTGTTGDKRYDELIANYFKTGTTGNEGLDAVINAYIDDMIEKTTDKDIADMVEKYMTDGTTGNKLFDLVIWTYLEDGTTHNKKLDELIMNAIAENLTKDKVAELVSKYLANGTTGNKLYDRLIKKYMETGSTGNAVIDKLIKDYLSNAIISGDISGDDLENLLGSLLGGGTGGMLPGDTRIYFTVALQYNDNLKNAELIRKGMTYTDRVTKLEVE